MVSGESFHAKKKKVMVELAKGKEIAMKLQTLLQKQDHHGHGTVSPQALAFQIFRSFSYSLSELTSSVQIAAVDYRGSASSGESKKKTGVKDQRGCYKRRRSSDSWVTVSPTMEDGYAWRKYGQKNILNSEFPRCYFRCTHKQEGCKATKQVQRIKGEEDPISYQITYFNHHTCRETLTRAPHHIVGSDPLDRNLISFQTDIQSSTNPIIASSSVKQEDDEDASDHEAKSTLEDDSWPDIIGLDPLCYKPEWASPPFQFQYSLHGPDMEVGQLSDNVMDSLYYFNGTY